MGDILITNPKPHRLGMFTPEIPALAPVLIWAALETQQSARVKAVAKHRQPSTTPNYSSSPNTMPRLLMH